MRRRDKGNFVGDAASTDHDEVLTRDERWRTMSKSRRTVIAVAAVVAPLLLMAGIGYGVYALVGYGIEASPVLNPMAGLRESHIEANVPDPDDFDRLLNRDVQSYFEGQVGEWVAVTCEVLSGEPYQVGLSYPKFNVWVRVSEGGVSLSEGLAWVAAVDKTGFEVYEYWSAEELRENVDSLEGAFPPDDYPKIMKKLGE